MSAYYNEIDPFAAAWLRELIKAGHIADGVVDERSIEDVLPNDLREFTQCHFFAGIGVWSYALRQAGWADDRRVWTGSCPCQPFSTAGKRGGCADERHLWPALYHLVEICRPPVVFGEQVASKDGLAWLDTVQTDMENAGYAFAPIDICVAGFGAPHLRQRLYFVADSADSGQWGRPATTVQRHSLERAGQHSGPAESRQLPRRLEGLGATGSMAEPERVELDGIRTARTRGAEPTERCDVGNNNNKGSQGRGLQPEQSACELPVGEAGLTNGHWRDAEWIYCIDGKWRATQPGLFPLAHGTASRVGRLRGYGNAIVAPQATAFVEAYLGH